MKKIFVLVLLIITSVAVFVPRSVAQNRFVSIKGHDLIKPDGQKLFIMGTNLGNWLNPEGYMFNFSKTNSAHFIDEMLRQLVGPDEAASFWKQFKENYITKADIDFIASTGANTIRIPFNYRLFTDEDYMGETGMGNGFELIDKVIGWCKENNLYVILDMHDAPGGQTGDNIDDSYGYPWLFVSEESQEKFCRIWKDIANHYKDEPAVLAYELLNEPIAPYFETDMLNSKLEDIYKKGVAAIREVDRNHIVILGAPQWNSNFKPLTDWTFDDKIIYSCHRYGGEATKKAIQSYIDFRDKTNLPMYMGEIGHNSNEWQADFCRVMKENNIGYTFWPYKKMDGSCFVGIIPPEQWKAVVDFAESDRSTYKAIREHRPSQETARLALKAFLEACKFHNCRIQQGYINTLQMKEPQAGAKQRK